MNYWSLLQSFRDTFFKLVMFENLDFVSRIWPKYYLF